MRGSMAVRSALALVFVSGFAGIGSLGTGIGVRVGVAVAAAAPLNTSAPSISGTPTQGQRLTANKGVFSGEKPITYSFSWLRCDAAGASCTAISPPSGAARRVVEADVGHALRVTVTATDPSGKTSATSDPTEPVAAAALRKSKAPKISGIARDGQVLTVSNGSWKGTAPNAFTYRWQACARSGVCTTIPGADAASYRVASQQLGSRLQVIVTATNDVSSLAQSSKRSAKILPGAPVSISAPSISGSLQEGQTLTADSGEWVGTGPIAFAYQWLRCSIAGGGCTEIVGATEPTYTAGTSDLASTLAVLVTASNAQGSAPASSPETQPILGILPTNSLLPSISGVLEDGQLLSIVNGSWSGTQPITYGYQWQLCNVLGQGCEAIAGATGPSISLDPSEIGKTLDVLVTATNAAGSTTLTSSLSGVIAGILPNSTALPSIAGVLQDGQLLNVTAGSWTGSAPISYAYQWQLCNALGEACENLAGAIGPSLALDPSEIGKTLDVLVTATNAAGSTSVKTPVTALITGILPKNTTLPSITGTLKNGGLLSAANGTWTGSAPIAYSYQWQLCVLSVCTNIAKATSSTFSLAPIDIGNTVRVLVNATNVAGTTTATSAATGLIGL